MRANGLVREANNFAEELGQQTRFSVTLQIPPQNLSPNRKRGAFVSEPAILVKYNDETSQIWSMEKLDLKLIDMRELYDELKSLSENAKELIGTQYPDPFSESTENHSLIGVANVFLSVLFHDVNLDHHTPIISQQGEVAGRLQVEIQRVSGSFTAQDGQNSDCSDGSTDENPTMTVQVTIKNAAGLPPSLSHFVFCQYSFWGDSEPTMVPPTDVDQNQADIMKLGQTSDVSIFTFNHTMQFTIPITEEFMEHCAEGALSIEVYGHRSAGFASKAKWAERIRLAKSLADR